jgi:hypothetical protein
MSNRKRDEFMGVDCCKQHPSGPKDTPLIYSANTNILNQHALIQQQKLKYTFKQTFAILLVKGKQLSGSFTDLVPSVLDHPDFQ